MKHLKLHSIKLSDKKYIQTNPANQTDNIPRKKTIREFLTLEEIILLDNTELPSFPEVKKAFLFSCFTGLRISDVKALKWENIKNDKINFIQVKNW